MRNEKMMLGQLTVDMVAFAEMGNQEFKNQFESFIQAKIVLTMPNGEKREFEIGEIIDKEITAFDPETDIEIEEEDQVVL
jgi:hypothetical protein